MTAFQRSFSLPSSSDEVDEPGVWDNSYAVRVTAHSERSMQRSLYTGVNYRAFVKFLHEASRVRSGFQQLSDEKPYVFASVHNLGINPGNAQRIKHFDGNSELTRFDRVLSTPSENGKLIFLKGYPSPGWVKLLGSRYRIDPEYFRRQLSLGSLTEYHELPSLPSSSRNIIELCVTSIGRCNYATGIRQEATVAVRKHFQALGEISHTGESIVRKFNRHDESTFSIEQRISLCLVMRDESWTGALVLETRFSANTTQWS